MDQSIPVRLVPSLLSSETKEEWLQGSIPVRVLKSAGTKKKQAIGHTSLAERKWIFPLQFRKGVVITRVDLLTNAGRSLCTWHEPNKMSQQGRVWSYWCVDRMTQKTVLSLPATHHVGKINLLQLVLRVAFKQGSDQVQSIDLAFFRSPNNASKYRQFALTGHVSPGASQFPASPASSVGLSPTTNGHHFGNSSSSGPPAPKLSDPPKRKILSPKADTKKRKMKGQAKKPNDDSKDDAGLSLLRAAALMMEDDDDK